MKIWKILVFYILTAIVYALYKTIFIAVHLEWQAALTYESILSYAGFGLFLLFSFSVAYSYRKRLHHAFLLTCFSCIWTSNVVWIWVYLRFLQQLYIRNDKTLAGVGKRFVISLFLFPLHGCGTNLQVHAFCRTQAFFAHAWKCQLILAAGYTSLLSRCAPWLLPPFSHIYEAGWRKRR